MRERNHFVGLWLNDEEYAHLRKQSEITGLPTSVLILHTIAGVQLRHRPPNEYAALLRALSSIGNNVDQIAHWANAKKSIQEAEIRQAVLLANKAWELVKETL